MRKIRFLILMFLTAIVPAAASAAVRVTVQPGETLSAIGQRYGVSAQAIASYNGISDPGIIIAGSTIAVPSSSGSGSSTSYSSSGSHTVQPGENLGSIAARYGTSARALAQANGITNPDMVVAGTRIRVSGVAATSSSSSESTSGGGHTVQPGENLGSIAARYGTTTQAIALANGINDPNMVVAGRTLRVSGLPRMTNASLSTSSSSGGSGHTVQPGENLGAIAARYGTSAQAIAKANGIANPNMVVAGTRLSIPASTSGTSVNTTGMTPITAQTAGWGGHPSRDQVAAMINQSAANYGVDPALVRAIAWQESGWWQGARSSVGAVGVMQLMPDTARWLGPAVLGRSIDPTNVKDNIDGGAAYLGYLLRRAPSRDLAIASYYQGLSSVTSRGLYEDTKAYVGSVNTHYGVR